MERTQYTQFGISARTKDKLDEFKARNKQKILEHRKKARRQVTNTDVIEYLLDTNGGDV